MNSSLARLKRLASNPEHLRTGIDARRQKYAELAYVTFDSLRLRIGRKPNALFVDAGSNVGQGFKWFSRRFSADRFDFHLLEPNPNCTPFLERICEEHPGAITLSTVGIGTEEAVMSFYGTSSSEGGELSQGGSLVKEHNSALYRSSDESAITVKTIDFSQFLIDQSKNYDVIVVKMDVEGAEIDVLTHLIAEGTHKLIDTLYLELHSEYAEASLRPNIVEKEQRLVARLRQDGVRLRLWH